MAVVYQREEVVIHIPDVVCPFKFIQKKDNNTDCLNEVIRPDSWNEEWICFWLKWWKDFRLLPFEFPDCPEHLRFGHKVKQDYVVCENAWNWNFENLCGLVDDNLMIPLTFCIYEFENKLTTFILNEQNKIMFMRWLFYNRWRKEKKPKKMNW